MSERELVVGTRGSRLALEQTRRVREALPGPSRELVIRTSGDRFQEVPLHEAGAVGFFTKEIEDQLRAGSIDLAVHSMKDLPTRLADGLTLAALLLRDDPGDILLVRPDALAEGRPIPMAPGRVVGASSLRRQALLGTWAPDLGTRPLRGNVPTRIDKARSGECDAIVLARAGLARLGLEVAPLLAFELNPRAWICAPGQAVIAVETRADDAETVARVTTLDHGPTRTCVEVERRLLQDYGGGCHAPFGAWARATDTGFEVRLAAPGVDGYLVESFVDMSLAAAYRQAASWISSPRARRGVTPEEPWICRPARPWC